MIRYAVSGLGFALEDIVLFAWSIGKWHLRMWMGLEWRPPRLPPLSLSLSLSLSPSSLFFFLSLSPSMIHPPTYHGWRPFTTFPLLGGYCASCAAMSYPDIGAVVSYSILAGLLSNQWTTGYSNIVSSSDRRCLLWWTVSIGQGTSHTSST